MLGCQPAIVVRACVYALCCRRLAAFGGRPACGGS